MKKKNSLPEDLPWHLYSGLLIFFISILTFLQWPNLPYFLDIYYHLNVAQGFEKAGGLVLWDFWEYAPTGRVHLYPPLFHLILLWAHKLGFSWLFLARFFSGLFYPSLLISLWIIVSKLFSRRFAFFVISCAFIPYAFFCAATIMLPSLICLILFLWIFFLLEKGLPFAAGCLLGLCFYSHLLSPWLMILALLTYGLCRRKKEFLFTILVGIFLGLPWQVHFLRNLPSLSYQWLVENDFLELNFFIIIMAAFGFAYALRQKGRYLIFIAIFAALFISIGLSHPHRFFNAEGLFALILLAAVALENLYLKLAAQWLKFSQKKAYACLLPIVLVYFLFFFSPALVDPETGESGFSFTWRGSSLANLLPGYHAIERSRQASLYDGHAEEIVTAIKANSQPEEIIYCSFEYYGGLLAAFSQRAQARGMLSEVKPKLVADPFLSSRIVVFIKTMEGELQNSHRKIARYYGLKKIFENILSQAYLNPQAKAKIKIVPALFSTTQALVIFLFWLSAIALIIYAERKGKR